MRQLRALLLIVPALLLMLGHGVPIGFCPCHESLFLMDCGCTGASQATAHACTDTNCCSHSTPAPSSSEGEEHDCGNVTAEPAPYFYTYSSSSTLSQISFVFCVIPDPFTFTLPLVWEQKSPPRCTGPPPLPHHIYTGFLSPLII